MSGEIGGLRAVRAQRGREPREHRAVFRRGGPAVEHADQSPIVFHPRVVRDFQAVQYPAAQLGVVRS